MKYLKYLLCWLLAAIALGTAVNSSTMTNPEKIIMFSVTVSYLVASIETEDND